MTRRAIAAARNSAILQLIPPLKGVQGDVSIHLDQRASSGCFR